MSAAGDARVVSVWPVFLFVAQLLFRRLSFLCFPGQVLHPVLFLLFDFIPSSLLTENDCFSFSICIDNSGKIRLLFIAITTTRNTIKTTTSIDHFSKFKLINGNIFRIPTDNKTLHNS